MKQVDLVTERAPADVLTIHGQVFRAMTNALESYGWEAGCLCIGVSLLLRVVERWVVARHL